MQAAHVLGFLGVAAVLGAVAGGVASITAQGDEGTTAGDEIVLDRLDQLARSIDGLRSSLKESQNSVADLEERLIGAEIDLQNRLETAARAPVAPKPTELAPGAFKFKGLPGSMDVSGMGGLDKDSLAATKAALQEAFAGRRAGLPESFRKSMELRALPEDDRWRRAEEELGLGTVQIDEIKAAQADLEAAMKDAMTEEKIETSGGFTSTFRRVDGNKMRTAQKKFEDRVQNTLNEEQKAAWDEKGYAGAFGRPRPRVWVGGLHGGDGKGGAGGSGGRVIISTGTIQLEDDNKSEDD